MKSQMTAKPYQWRCLIGINNSHVKYITTVLQVLAVILRDKDAPRR